MTDPIGVQLRALEDTRTPEKACVYEAVCMIDTVTYTARSRSGAASELARVLVAAGIPDAPLQVLDARLRGHLSYRSFHAAALYTIEENARGLRRIPYARVVAARERLRRGVVEGAKQGPKALSASTDAPEASAPRKHVHVDAEAA